MTADEARLLTKKAHEGHDGIIGRKYQDILNEIKQAATNGKNHIHTDIDFKEGDWQDCTPGYTEVTW